MRRTDWVLVSEPPDRWLCFECYRDNCDLCLDHDRCDCDHPREVLFFAGMMVFFRGTLKAWPPVVPWAGRNSPVTRCTGLEWACAHCGQACGDDVGGWRSMVVGGRRVMVCHPEMPGRPDCSQRVTVYGEPLGVLRTVRLLPPGIAAIRNPGMAGGDTAPLDIQIIPAGGRFRIWCTAHGPVGGEAGYQAEMTAERAATRHQRSHHGEVRWTPRRRTRRAAR